MYVTLSLKSSHKDLCFLFYLIRVNAIDYVKFLSVAHQFQCKVHEYHVFFLSDPLSNSRP